MRVNTSWAFAGHAVYAGGQWAVLVLLVNALSPAEVGRYAYALAVTSPIFVLAGVRLRHVLATAVASPGDFRDYLTTRLLTTGCALFASLAIGAFSTSSRETLIVIVLVALARSCDAVSDICHGLFQRGLDMRTAAAGLMINGIVSALLVQGALGFWQSLPLAAVGLRGRILHRPDLVGPSTRRQDAERAPRRLGRAPADVDGRAVAAGAFIAAWPELRGRQHAVQPAPVCDRLAAWSGAARRLCGDLAHPSPRSPRRERRVAGRLARAGKRRAADAGVVSGALVRSRGVEHWPRIASPWC